MRLLIITLLLLNTPFLNGQNTVKARIDSILNSEYSGANSPGITVGVIKDGAIIYHGQIGFANLEYDIPFDDNTVFGLASVNDDVRKHIPELAFYGDTIRIVHLLNHTSGIRNHNIRPLQGKTSKKSNKKCSQLFGNHFIK